ncbi:Uncharacterised protein [Mycobacterium tuberculosis]|nr:Uncharacterised protein [Mycobacterium tuberculosis]
MSAACTFPSTSARTVTAPPASSIATKLPGLIVSPYFCFRPGSPDGRDWKSDGAANLTSAECTAKSAIVVRSHSLAVALVTVTVSVSDAADGLRIDRSAGNRWWSSSSTASSMVAFELGAKYSNKLPMYSGTRSIEWSLSAGTYVSRLPIPGRRPTSKPLACKA